MIYHKIVIKNKDNLSNKTLTSNDLEIVRDGNRIKKDKNIAEFFSFLNYKIDSNPIENFEAYKLNNEQAKYLEKIKYQINSNIQNAITENEKQEIVFILFSGLILMSKVRSVWMYSEMLRQKYETPYNIIDEMTSIRLTHYPDGSEKITPFSQTQIEICKEYNLDVPIECL